MFYKMTLLPLPQGSGCYISNFSRIIVIGELAVELSDYV